MLNPQNIVEFTDSNQDSYEFYFFRSQSDNKLYISIYVVYCDKERSSLFFDNSEDTTLGYSFSQPVIDEKIDWEAFAIDKDTPRYSAISKEAISFAEKLSSLIIFL